jgi:hypothetical protein
MFKRAQGGLVYSLGTSSLTVGDYKVTATLDDGGQLTGQFSPK